MQICQGCNKKIKTNELVTIIASDVFIDHDGDYNIFDLFDKQEFWHTECLNKTSMSNKDNGQENETNDVYTSPYIFSDFKDALNSMGVKAGDIEVSKFLSQHRPKSVEDAVQKWFSKL